MNRNSVDYLRKQKLESDFLEVQKSVGSYSKKVSLIALLFSPLTFWLLLGALLMHNPSWSDRLFIWIWSISYILCLVNYLLYIMLKNPIQIFLDRNQLDDAEERCRSLSRYSYFLHILLFVHFSWVGLILFSG